jgi:hypothetical protein
MHALLSTGHVRAIHQFFMNLLNIESHKNPFSSSRVVALKQEDGQKDGVIFNRHCPGTPTRL